MLRSILLLISLSTLGTVTCAQNVQTNNQGIILNVVVPPPVYSQPLVLPTYSGPSQSQLEADFTRQLFAKTIAADARDQSLLHNTQFLPTTIACFYTVAPTVLYIYQDTEVPRETVPAGQLLEVQPGLSIDKPGWLWVYNPRTDNVSHMSPEDAAKVRLIR